MSDPAIASLPTVALKPRRALPFFNRHPWVFAGALANAEAEIAPGTEVAVVTDRGEFVARGLYNPDSNIRVRLYTWRADEPLDREFWQRRIDEAVRLRERVLPGATASGATASADTGAAGTRACRLVFSEADGLSGLTVDRYGDWLTLQLTSRALAAHLDDLRGLLEERLSPRGIWLRTEKGIRELEGLEVEDGCLSGEMPSDELVIEDGGVRFRVDLVAGQKTGFYLDQRENRLAAARYVRGHRVLDAFCYSGGFGLAALVCGGAASVVGIDSSAAALELAGANAALNGVADRTEYRQSDVQPALVAAKSAGERFDTIVLDPPKMTRHRKGVERALKGYAKLNRAALDVLEPDGLLVTCTCSGLISRDDFLGMLSNVAQQADRRIQVLEQRGAAVDHPTSVACLETDYLQCYVCRVSG